MKRGTRKKALLAGGVVGASALIVALGAFALEPPQPVITPGKVGGIRLGAGYGKLHKLGFIGKIRSGCEASGPKARSAPLRVPWGWRSCRPR